MKRGLSRGPLPGNAVHLCVDMQRMFAEDTEWSTPWMERVLPNVVRLAEAAPDRTVFTRFIPAAKPGDGQGTWKGYYERWASMTLVELGEEMVGLVPELARLVPPATVIDKKVYSPWFQPELARHLTERGCDTLLVSGGETDVCVLATILGAVDRGLRVVVVDDALCSSSDEAHDASVTLYLRRYGQQIEVATVDEVLADGPEARGAPTGRR